MTDIVRCPACRGSKKVPKLGGMIGECNTCTGKGTILSADKPKPVVVEEVQSQAEIITAVANALPVSSEPELPVPEEPYINIKIDGKKALYKRKTATSR